MRKMLVLIPMIALVLAGCGQSEGTLGGAATTVPTTGPAESPAVPTDAPTAAPEPTAVPKPTAAPEPSVAPDTGASSGAQPDQVLVSTAQTRLAAQLGLADNQLTLQSALAQEWPNSGLGCPAPDQMYAEVITPGFLLTFSSGAATYTVHTGQEGQMVLCQDGKPTALAADGVASGDAPVSSPPDAGSVPAQPEDPRPVVSLNETNRPLVELATQSLARNQRVAPSDVQVTEIREVQWNDSSLGCPRPDEMYMQVITPGYQITLQTNGQAFVYHTDMKDRVVLCEQ